MSDAILFINTMKIPAAELSEFTQKLQRTVEFVDAHGPQLMLEAYVDESRACL